MLLVTLLLGTIALMKILLTNRKDLIVTLRGHFHLYFYDLYRTCWFYWKHGEEFTLRHVQRSFFIILSIRISQNRLIEVIFSLRHIDIAGTGIMMKNYSKKENPFTWAGELERFENLSTDIPDPILDPNGS